MQNKQSSSILTEHTKGCDIGVESNVIKKRLRIYGMHHILNI